MISLGERYRDRITGIEGTATATTAYLSGSVSIRLERLDSQGNPVENWISENRLVPVEAKPKAGL